jgi:D-serine deaminase-like pyridoxal phosphate-dependent protein
VDLEALAEAVARVELPAVLVDIDAFDRNLVRHAAVAEDHGLTLRFATKSIRVRALIERALTASCARGLMCFTVREARRSRVLGRGLGSTISSSRTRRSRRARSRCGAI